MKTLTISKLCSLYRFKESRYLVRMFALGYILLASGCASLDTSQSAANPVALKNTEITDPWEDWNRGVYGLNERIDQYVLKPAAKSYQLLVPLRLRASINNFFSNLTQPTTIINDLLQGQLEQSLQDTARFVFNSTFGVLGLFDFASYLELPKHREDFGQTLAVWNVPPGPYVVLPLLGPSSLRDAFGLAPEYSYTDAVPYLFDHSSYWAATMVNIVDNRSNKLGREKVLSLQLDPYSFTKESYTQSRLNVIFNGSPPLPDDLLDEEPTN